MYRKRISRQKPTFLCSVCVCVDNVYLSAAELWLLLFLHASVFCHYDSGIFCHLAFPRDLLCVCVCAHICFRLCVCLHAVRGFSFVFMHILNHKTLFKIPFQFWDLWNIMEIYFYICTGGVFWWFYVGRISSRISFLIFFTEALLLSALFLHSSCVIVTLSVKQERERVMRQIGGK